MLACPGVGRAEEGCAPAIARAERENTSLPAGLLRAIGIVESGRRDPLTRQVEAWPWSVNAAGDDYVFETQREAIAFVQDALARGIRSIDVGCMQVNLMYHPNAFASLEEAFTPAANVRYATAFLLDLRQRTGDWGAATGHYHSATAGLSEAYAQRVQAALTGANPMMPALPFPPPWPGVVMLLPPAVMIGAAARRVQVFVPGAAPIHPIIFRGAANLPRVYHP